MVTMHVWLNYETCCVYRECESSLGREVVHQAMKLLSKSEEAEVRMT